jgi:hypothetical protein
LIHSMKCIASAEGVLMSAAFQLPWIPEPPITIARFAAYLQPILVTNGFTRPHWNRPLLMFGSEGSFTLFCLDTTIGDKR